MFDTDLLGILFFGFDGSISAANDTFLQAVGYSRADLEAGRLDWAAMTPPEYAALDQAKVRELKDVGRVQAYEKEYIRRDGSRMPILLGAAKVDDAGGVCFVLDLTEQQRAELESRNSEELRQIALDVAKLGVCRFDLTTGTVTRDAQAAWIAGRGPDELGPYPLQDLFAGVQAEDLPLVQQAYESGARGERSEPTFRWVRPDGTIRTVRAAVYPEWRAAGRAGPVTALTVTLLDVTEVQQALRRQELWTEVLENAPDFVGVCDAEGRAEFVNAAGREIVGLTEEEAKGRSAREFHPAEGEGRTTAIAMQTARREGRWSGDSVLLKADGTHLPVSQTVLAHRNEVGAITHFSTICRDISERVRAEEVSNARRECLGRLAVGDPLPEVLSVLAEAAERHLPTPNLVCILLRDGAAEGALPPAGPGRGTVPGEKLRLASAPSLPDSFREGIDGLAADETGGACGAAAIRAKRVIVEDLSADPLCEQFRDFMASHDLKAVWSNPIFAADGAVLGTFAIYHDHARVPNDRDFKVVDPLVHTAAVVVERAATDARTLRLADELKQSERRFRGTFDNVGVGVAHVGLDGSWLEVNRRLCEIVGYPEDELRALTFQDITHPDDLSNDLELFGRLLSGEIPSYTMRKRYFHKSGEVIWIQLTVAMQLTAEKEPEYAISVVENITEKVRAEQELHELNATLELQVASRTTRVRRQKARLERLAKGLSEAEARERRRLAHVVHDDIQQVLAAAKISASGLLVRERKEMEGKRGPAGATVQLLDEAMARARSLTQELVPTVLYDRGLVPALVALCRRSEERFQHAVRFTGLADDQPPPSGFVDRSEPAGPLMFHAARELLFNATKHAPRSPVRVALGRTDDYRLQLVVSNPLEQDGANGGRPKRAAGDTSEDAAEGFGLFSLREQAALAGGALKIRQTSNLFVATLTLPPHPHVSQPQSMPVTAPALPTVRVMIVDDHLIVRTALAGLLAGTEGVEVVGEAADGREAVERVQEVRPDTVVMDVTMPRMDGIEATREVRKLMPNVRVIGLSMHDRDDMAEAMCEAGAAAYVPKGGPPEELIRVLRGEETPNNC
ncbi:PAS domain S-box protein [Alienimonas chondri]|uniref:PAS domain S-box protein n=1 Tax=Alienimonas chondri TaxID=2681879 RepID=UPI001487FDB8|nr:PAS domain S-box protein [Alienimonas chondri]